eukprot:3033026-Alexandrium_andersonii.AAC.1
MGALRLRQLPHPHESHDGATALQALGAEERDPDGGGPDHRPRGGRPQPPGEEHPPAPGHRRVLSPQEHDGQWHPDGAGAGNDPEQVQGHPPGHAGEPAVGLHWR